MPIQPRISGATETGQPVTTTDVTGFSPAQFATFNAAKALAPAGTVMTTGTPQTGSGSTQPPKEPAVITSGNIDSKVIPDLHARADNISQKGTYAGQDGKLYYSDNSLVPAPLDAEYDPTTTSWKNASGSYGAAPQYVDNTDNDPDLAKTNELFAAMRQSLDSNTLSQVNVIQQQFDMLRAEQRDANERADKSRGTLNLRSGTTRFAPLDAAGTALAQTTYGLKQIAKLDADENSAIAKVRQAQSDGNFQLMEKALGVAEDTRKAKQEAAAKVADQLSKANDKLLEERAKASQDESIASLVAQGITDPAQIQNYLNYHDDGTPTGGNVDLSTIKSALNNLKPTADAKDPYQFSQANTGQLLAANLTMPEIQAIQDFYNGKGKLPDLTAEQQDAVTSVLNGTAAKVAASGVPTYAQLHPKANAGGKEKVYTSGSLDYTPADIAQGNSTLSTSRNEGPEADGEYADPNVYLAHAQAWTDHGGSIKDFLKNFPISSWINPANTFVVPEINALVRQDAAGTTTAKPSNTESDLNAAIDAAIK